jgi:hypothetical protein
MLAIAAGSAGAGEGTVVKEDTGSEYDDLEYELNSMVRPIGGARA